MSKRDEKLVELRHALHGLALHASSGDAVWLRAGARAIDKYLELLRGGTGDTHLYTNILQGAIAALPHGRGTVGEKALATLVLLRRDIDALKRDAQEAREEAKVAFEREQQALRDVESRLAALRREHEPALLRLRNEHAAELEARDARHRQTLGEIAAALDRFAQGVRP